MASNKTTTEVKFSLQPVEGGKFRTMNGWDLMAVQICWGIAAWFFLTGAQTGLYLPAKEAIPTIIAGNCIPLVFIALSGILGARYGIEQFTLSTNVFGRKLTGIFCVFGIVAIMIPNASASLMFGQAMTKFVSIFSESSSFASGGFGVMFWAFFCAIVGAGIAYFGPDVLKWFTRVAAVGMILVLMVFVIYILFYYGIDKIFDAKPQGQIAPTDDAVLNLKWNRASALEINFGLGISWAFCFGQWTRLAKSEAGGYHGCMWGFGLLSAVAGTFSAFAALAIGAYDPTLWVLQISEETSISMFSIIGLLLMAVANISSIATVTYTMALSARVRFPKFKWTPTCIVVALIPLPLISPDMYEKITNIYAVVALLTTMYAGCLVADYLFISKGKLNLRECYNRKDGYNYWKGYNPAALVATLAGMTTYLLIYNPITLESATGLFPYITAGFPTFAVTIIVYTLCMKCWVLKKYPVSFINNIPHDNIMNRSNNVSS